MATVERKGLTSLEALGVAVRWETDAGEMFRKLMERSDNRIVKRRFELLAAEADQHREYLVERYEELARGVPLKLPSSQLPREMTTPASRADMTLERVLDLAIDAKRHAREFYLRAAREAEDLSGRAMFRFLADMAHQHWLTLAQEKDLLVRYPNYGRPGRMPWRTEKSLRPVGHEEE